jgi:hypothetical protein
MDERSTGAGEARAGAEAAIPERLVRGALRPFQQFVRTESAGGIVLLACTALALALANSPWAGGYRHLWELPLTLGVPGFGLTKSLHHWRPSSSSSSASRSSASCWSASSPRFDRPPCRSRRRSAEWSSRRACTRC